MVQACLAADWLEPQGAGIVLTEAGRAFLRRGEATDDVFRQQHQLRVRGETEINGARSPLVVNVAESPLSWLRNRKDRNRQPLLTHAQFEAGERLRADYYFAHLSARVTSDWSA